MSKIFSSSGAALLSIFQLLLLGLSIQSHVHTCIHDEIQKNVKIQSIQPMLEYVSPLNERLLLSSIAWRDYRVIINYEIFDKFITDVSIREVKKTQAHAVMDSVKKYLTQRFQVFSYPSVDLSSITSCGGYTTPSSVATTVESDLVVLVVGINDSNASYYASAFSCSSLHKRYLPLKLKIELKGR
jgi:hypothetical protein